MALSNITKRVLSLAGVTAFSQVISLLALPFVTRIYTPETLGVLAAGLSAMTVLSVIASLRYEQAIPLVSSYSESSILVYLSLTLALLTTLIATGVLYFSSRISSTFAQAIPYPILIGLGAYFLAVLNILIMWATGRRMIKTIAVSRLVFSVTDTSLKVGVGIMTSAAVVLLSSHLASLVLTSLVFVATLLVCRALPTLSTVNFGVRIRNALFAHRRFFKLGLLETFFTTIAMQVPIVLIAILFSSSEAALLFLAQQVMRGPITLISNAAGRVFLSELASAQKNGSIKALFGEHMLLIFRIGVPIILFLGIAGSAVVELVFGENYSDLTFYLRWMVPWMVMVMLTTPFTAILYSFERFGTALALAAVGALLRIGAIFVSYHFSLEPIATLSLASIMTYIGYLVIITAIVGFGFKGWVQSLLLGAWPITIAISFGFVVIFALNVIRS